MFQFCQYADALGKPGEGVHQYRMPSIAIVDFVLTFILAWVLQIVFNWLFGLHVHYLIYLILTFILGIVLHRVFCVKTTIDKLLFD